MRSLLHGAAPSLPLVPKEYAPGHQGGDQYSLLFSELPEAHQICPPAGGLAGL